MLERRLFFVALGVSGLILGLIYRNTADRPATRAASVPSAQLAGNLTGSR